MRIEIMRKDLNIMPEYEFENKMKLGYAYVPIQSFTDLYTIDEAFENATLFKQLNIPMSEYVPRGSEGG